MTRTDNPAEVGRHVFERAGLGKAPFRFTGMRENAFRNGDGTTRAGGSCDYCGTAIRFEFWIESADRKRSKVGCDCINKSGDGGLIKAYKASPQLRAMEREKRQAKDKEVSAALDAYFLERAGEWKAAPHPYGFTDFKTGGPLSLWDYMTRLRSMCGAAGRARLLRAIAKKAAAIGAR